MRLDLRGAGVRIAAATLCLALLTGCGGDAPNSFARSVYVEITSSGALSPVAIAMPNGYRIVFLNNDSVPHSITWNSPLTLTATAQPGDRAWFDLPMILPGTVLSYHLDSSGPSGSVTVINPL